MIENKLSELLGRPVKTKLVLAQKSAPSSIPDNQKKNNVFEAVLQTFGGEVVD